MRAAHIRRQVLVELLGCATSSFHAMKRQEKPRTRHLTQTLSERRPAIEPERRNPRLGPLYHVHRSLCTSCQ